MTPRNWLFIFLQQKTIWGSVIEFEKPRASCAWPCGLVVRDRWKKCMRWPFSDGRCIYIFVGRRRDVLSALAIRPCKWMEPWCMRVWLERNCVLRRLHSSTSLFQLPQPLHPHRERPPPLAPRPVFRPFHETSAAPPHITSVPADSYILSDSKSEWMWKDFRAIVHVVDAALRMKMSPKYLKNHAVYWRNVYKSLTVKISLTYRIMHYTNSLSFYLAINIRAYSNIFYSNSICSNIIIRILII